MKVDASPDSYIQSGVLPSSIHLKKPDNMPKSQLMEVLTVLLDHQNKKIPYAKGLIFMPASSPDRQPVLSPPPRPTGKLSRIRIGI